MKETFKDILKIFLIGLGMFLFIEIFELNKYFQWLGL